MTEKQELRLPMEGEHVRAIGTFIRTEEIPPPDPPPPKYEYIFERVEANCWLRLNDEELKGLGCFWDFGGVGCGVKSAIAEMTKYAVERNIDADSELEVVVVEVRTQYRAIPLDRENCHDPRYHDFARANRPSMGLPEPEEKVVWSSKGLAE